MGPEKTSKNQNLHLTGGGVRYCKICIGFLGKKANDARAGAVRTLLSFQDEIRFDEKEYGND